MAKNQPMTPPAGDEIFLLKMGEMVLKGLNRRTFEERLMGNARRRLEKFGKFRIYSRQSITYIEPKTEDCDMDGAFETLTRLFGVVGLSRAKVTVEHDHITRMQIRRQRRRQLLGCLRGGSGALVCQSVCHAPIIGQRTRFARAPAEKPQNLTELPTFLKIQTE